MKEVVDYLKARGVENLVHFTPWSNLDRIKREGIVPREELEASDDGDFSALDEIRLDGRLQMSCFSLSFPNFLMMYRYRQKLKGEGCDIALLFISIDVLGRLTNDQVLFLPTNAASRRSRGMEETNLRGLGAVEEMFAPEALTRTDRVFNRATASLPTFLTTDPQAEVQISATIPWSDVSFIVVPGYSKKKELLDAGLHGKIYAKWEVKGNSMLNVFAFPKVWSDWIERGEVDGGEAAGI